MTSRIPVCTYRLQFNKNFNFRNAIGLVDYLDALGVTDIYASPLLIARPGSVHGYDVIDHGRLNPELGTDGDLDALSDALKTRGMGLLLDVVPNHMCIATSDNHWWNDVLENGRSSPFASFFDIDWHPPKSELDEKVLLPVLGRQYGRVLEDKEIQIGYAAGAFYAEYSGHRFPIGPRTILPLLEPIVADLRRTHPDDHPDVLEMESIVTASKNLPTRRQTDPELIRERQREKEIVKRRIDALVSSSASVQEALERSLTAINGERGKPHSFDALEGLLAEQAYRLSYWGVAAEEINYRRFFDINDLAAIRIEEPKVLDAVHEKAFQLLRAGKVTGLRIDHVDGLSDPRRYLEDLQRQRDAAPEASPNLYVVVEKILIGAEELPIEWPVHGTTGYELLNIVNGLFVDAGGLRALERGYRRLREGTGTFDDLLYRAKKLILRTAMSSELYVLARRLDRVSEQHRWSRDFTASTLQEALAEVIACFPVYRTYIQSDTAAISDGDRLHILRAVREAKRRNRSTSESIFDFIADVLLLRDPDGISEADRAERRDLVMRLQQLTGPVMAKGLEDTVFYRYYPLASLNEVGGRPTTGPTEPDRFHVFCARRLERWPHGLSATATHDTKRGEDMRARLDVLSEIPREWMEIVRHWQRMNRRHKPLIDETLVPGTNEEYFIYQTLLGVWPLEALEGELPEAAQRDITERVSGYLRKALREAKLHTSWVNINEPYEQACDQFLRRLLEPGENAFLANFQKFLPRVAHAGVCNSLAQLVLKVTVPGVPDFYQGTELWDYTLVDPDNRRPVDYGMRSEQLDALVGLSGAALRARIRQALARPADGVLKLLITMRALAHRRERRDLFATGAYRPLGAEGPRAAHVVAFARGEQSPSITAVGRLFAMLGSAAHPPIGEEIWGGTRLVLPDGFPDGEYREVITGATLAATRESGRLGLPLEQGFSALPVAIFQPG